MVRKKIDIAAKKKHLNFVMLSEQEYSELCGRLGPDGAADWIEELDLYLGSKGAKYESHYYTILAWARRKMKRDAVTRGQGDTGTTAQAERLVEDLKRYRAMPAGFPEAITIRFRAMCQKSGTSWPRLHHELQSGIKTPEDIKKDFCSVSL